MSDALERIESAPVLVVFGAHAARMSRLLRIRPSLLERVAYAPRRAIHAIGAFLHLAAPATQNDIEVAHVLDTSDPRDLLQQAIPDAPPRLYRALERAGDRVKGRRFYERLAALCRTNLANELLDGELHELRFSRAEKILALDPALVRLPNILLISPNCVEALDVVIGFLRAQGVLRQSDLEVPPQAGLSAIARRLLLALDNVTAASVSFDLLPPFHLIQRVGELRRTGSGLRNCIWQGERFSIAHWFALASGEALYVSGVEPPLLAFWPRQ